MMERDKYLQITRAARECVLCGRSLDAVQRHPSILSETAGDTQRRDICPECWEKSADLSYFSFWLAKRTRPTPNRKLAKTERNEVLWRLFSALTTRQVPETEPQRFLLAHLLMKYGVLRWKANLRDEENVDWIVFEHLPTSDEYRVREHAMAEGTLVKTLQEIDSMVMREVDPSVSDAAKL